MLVADELLEAAKLQTGLSNYGAMDFAVGLRVLVHSINTDAALTPDNEIRVRDSLIRILVNKLRMQRDFERHPEIFDEVVLPPIFITSLPRTGSTKLHRLLAASGEFNAMAYWQSFNFAPLSDEKGPGPDPRIAAAEKHIEWLGQRSRLYMEAHPIYADEVEEELFILDAGFNCLYNHGSFLNVTSYIEWSLKQDPTNIFKEMKRVLQYLQWQHFPGSNKRWILKTPALLGLEKPFANVFTGADFIVTHRQPEKIVASVCALLTGIRKVYNEYDYADIAGEMIMMSFGETVKSHLQWRDGYPADKVLDVRFSEVASNEFEVLPKIFEFLKIPLTTEARNKMQAWLDMDAARRLPSSTFTLAQYGLDAPRVNERFAGYIQRYAEYL